ncbi:radical SAM domain protein, partial [Tribonema minus]
SYTVVPTYECFNRCAYCTFRADPRRGAASWLSVDDATAQMSAAMRQGTVREVLIMSGEVAPSSALRAPWLARVLSLCEAALSLGLHPHVNVGPLSAAEMAAVRARSVSMGLMLEQLSPALAARGGVHRHAPSKRDPQARLAQLEQAGRLKVPFTTGVLLGVGEGAGDTEASLRAIADVALRYGHIQECIIQPYSPAAGTRAGLEGFPLSAVPAIVAMARAILPPQVVVQVPPNLVRARGVLLECLDAGARDLGGISPLDEVNSAYDFPAVDELAAVLNAAGYRLRERLAVHDRLREWVPADLQPLLERTHADIGGAAFDERIATPPRACAAEA